MMWPPMKNSFMGVNVGIWFIEVSCTKRHVTNPRDKNTGSIFVVSSAPSKRTAEIKDGIFFIFFFVHLGPTSTVFGIVADKVLFQLFDLGRFL